MPGLHHEAVPQAAKVRNEPCGVEFWEFFGNPHAKIIGHMSQNGRISRPDNVHMGNVGLEGDSRFRAGRSKFLTLRYFPWGFTAGENYE